MFVKRFLASALALTLLGTAPAFAVEAAQPEEPAVPYEEEIAGTWYADATREAYQKGWLDAVEGERFDADTLITRGMAVDALWRLAGSPMASISTGYADVEAENPYHNAIDWAWESGVATGVGGGNFGWDRSVTREQLAVMLYRYARTQGQGFTGTWMLLLDTADREQVSDWAYESVCWLFMNGVMTGRGKNFTPHGSTTRAELAVILSRYAALGSATESA